MVHYQRLTDHLVCEEADGDEAEDRIHDNARQMKFQYNGRWCDAASEAIRFQESGEYYREWFFNFFAV